MADVFATSFGVLNYSGMLFNKGNVKTPLSSIIGSKAKTTNHVEFVTGLLLHRTLLLLPVSRKLT